MKKITAIISLILCFALVFCACSAKTANETTTEAESLTAETTTEVEKLPDSAAPIRFGVLQGPTGMGAAYLFECNSNGTSKAKYETTLASSPDVFKASLINGDLDMAALPTNVAAALYAKTEGKVQILSVNTLGVIYILDKTGEVKTLADLKGKTVLSAGQGTTTEYVLNYLLEKNGLKAGTDVTVEYASEHAQVVSDALAGKYSVILLPEPFVTQMKAKDASFNTAIDLTAEWDKLGGGSLTMGCIAVRTEFAQNNPEAVAAFLADYQASIEYVNANTEASAALIEKYEIAKAAVAVKALPNCNITFMAGDTMKNNVSAYLNVLFESNAASVGGALPDDNFYCIAK